MAWLLYIIVYSHNAIYTFAKLIDLLIYTQYVVCTLYKHVLYK